MDRIEVPGFGKLTSLEAAHLVLSSSTTNEIVAYIPEPEARAELRPHWDREREFEVAVESALQQWVDEWDISDEDAGDYQCWLVLDPGRDQSTEFSLIRQRQG
jgi:hypothetical protein